MCGQTVTNCDAVFAGLVLSASCQSKFLAASCSDLTTTPPPADLEACFPSCSGGDTCNSNGTITGCSNGLEFVFTCGAICSAESATYSGTCSASYMGQTAQDGESCWCK